VWNQCHGQRKRKGQHHSWLYKAAFIRAPCTRQKVSRQIFAGRYGIMRRKRHNMNDSGRDCEGFLILERTMRLGTTFLIFISILLLSGLTYCIAESEDKYEEDEENGESSKQYFRIFAAHVIMTVIAWAFLTPIAVASSFLPSLLPIDWWFKVHLCFNSLSYISLLSF